MMRSILIIVCCTIIISCAAQKKFISSIKKGVPFTGKGYLINLNGKYGDWYFQPCSDSSTSLFDALNGNSFRVQNITSELGYTFFEDLDGLGKKALTNYYDNLEKKEKRDTLTYLFCRISIEVVEEPEELEQCDFLFHHDKKSLSCIFFQNYLTDVEPLDPEIRRRYLQLYMGNKWPLPKWAK